MLWNMEIESKDFTLRVKWRISDQKNQGEWTEYLEITRNSAEVWAEDPRNDKLHKINFRDHGIKPIPVGECHFIEIAILNPTRNYFSYVDECEA